MKRLILAVLFILIGCSPDIRDGEIVERQFYPEADVLIMMPVVTSYGKNTTTTLIPIIQHYPDRWRVRIKKYKDGEWHFADWYVNKNAFDQCQMGRYFVIKDSSTTDEPHWDKNLKD